MDETQEETRQGKTLVGTWLEPELVAMLDAMKLDLNRSQFIRRLLRQEWNRMQGMVITPADQRRPAGGPR